MSFDQYNDLQPIKFKEYQSNLCQIAYTDDYLKSIGYLNQLMKLKEYSTRSLELTTHLIEINPAHYTVWNYRYEIIKNLYNKENDIQVLDNELNTMEEIILNNPKNYQIWNYRELLLKLHPNPSIKTETPIVESILLDDSKNYHVWNYKIWLLNFFNLFNNPQELKFVDNLIEKDLRNNSAWNYKFYLLFGGSDGNVKKEIQFVKKVIEKSPQNSSAWNYLTGIYSKFDFDIIELKDFCLSFNYNNNCKSIYSLQCLLKIYKKENDALNYDKVLEILKVVDPIRINYWNYLSSDLNTVQ